MASYKLTEEAKDDLIRIHRWGVENHGEEAADKYYSAFFDRLEQLAENPLAVQSLTELRYRGDKAKQLSRKPDP